MFTYRAKLLRVVDGDTLDLEMDLGFGIYHRIRVRLAGVDTPEIYGVRKDSDEYSMGKKASAFTSDWLRDKQITVKTERDKKGKYGRYLAYIFDQAGRSLNEAILNKEN